LDKGIVVGKFCGISKSVVKWYLSALTLGLYCGPAKSWLTWAF